MSMIPDESINYRLQQAWTNNQTADLKTLLKQSTPQDRLNFVRWVNVSGDLQSAPFTLKLESVRVLTELSQKENNPVSAEEDKELASLARNLKGDAQTRHQGLTGQVVRLLWDRVNFYREASNALRADLPQTSQVLLEGEDKSAASFQGLMAARPDQNLTALLSNTLNEENKSLRKDIKTFLTHLTPVEAEQIVKDSPDALADLTDRFMFGAIDTLCSKLSQETLMKEWSNPQKVNALFKNFPEDARGVDLLSRSLTPENFAQTVLRSDDSGKNGLYAAISNVGIDGLEMMANKLSTDDFAEAAFAKYGMFSDSPKTRETFLCAVNTHNVDFRVRAAEIIYNKLPDDLKQPFVEAVKHELARPLFVLTEMTVGLIQAVPQLWREGMKVLDKNQQGPPNQ